MKDKKMHNSQKIMRLSAKAVVGTSAGDNKAKLTSLSAKKSGFVMDSSPSPKPKMKR